MSLSCIKCKLISFSVTVYFLGEDEKVKQSRIKAAQEAVKREEQRKSKKKGEEDSDGQYQISFVVY